jgi:catechol 2,3-dioxygenase-like lactoylglutathione lyase family enzyme
MRRVADKTKFYLATRAFSNCLDSRLRGNDVFLVFRKNAMITAILHVTFLTADLEKSRAFYQDLLGLQPDKKRPQMSFDGVWYDVAPSQQIHIMLLPNPETGLPRPAHGGRDRHVALGVSDLDELIKKLDAAGVSYTLSQSGRRALFCRDPDDNALEFIANS